MADIIRRDELFEVALRALLASNPLIDERIARQTGSEVNSLLEAAVSVGEEVVYQVALTQRDVRIATAEGSALDELAWDWFSLTRDPANQAEVTLRFSHSNTALTGSISVGTAVKTDLGVEFTTLDDVNFGVGDASKDVSAIATIAGPAGNVLEDTLTNFDEPSWDPDMTVTNPDIAAGGDNSETDSEFRERVRGLWQVAEKGTRDAVLYGAISTPGVRTADVLEYDIDPLQLNTARSVQCLVADSNGNSNANLLDAVDTELENWRACGIYVEMVGGVRYDAYITASFNYKAGFNQYETNTRVKTALVAYVNSLGLGDTLEVGSIRDIIKKDRGVAGNVVVSFPLSSVTPESNQVIRTQAEFITLNG